ncbi:GGDEF domain-containing protein [Companilactobacillus kimchiensis]|uniref:GGDEF domain-containing protein n=1 Tax=Companilactobacillus kimchiensis TaxID=993692 RepID=UPI00070FF540|nr:GGDEF domain-containing protein [Companilactobacillus kimchiensis]
MTWYVWHVSPFITSIFFILGVFTLYQVLYDWIKSLLHIKKINLSDNVFNSWFGVLYMLVFIFSMQASLVGRSISWEFMNFQIIALVFCAYFLNIRLPYYFFVPIVLVYMVFNDSIGYWQSWCHAFSLMSAYWTMNYLRRHETNNHPFINYILAGTFFGSLMWFFVKLKFSLTWSTFFQEWFYLIIFEILLYSYVTMILRDSEIKLHLLDFANHDALTKIENYAAYTSEMKYLFSASTHNRLNMSMMMFDIDHFKQVNDTYGHLAGDKVLQQVAEVVQTIIAANDPKVKFYRTGGEEFNVLFPGYDLKSTELIVNEIFSAINHLDIVIGDKHIKISISMGVSQISKKDEVPNDLYKRVDNNLYHSKENGRMQITVN